MGTVLIDDGAEVPNEDDLALMNLCEAAEEYLRLVGGDETDTEPNESSGDDSGKAIPFQDLKLVEGA